MNRSRWYCAFLMLISMFSNTLSAQSESEARISKVIAVLSKSVDLKNSVAGDELTLHTICDVVVDGQLVIPKGSRVVGQVAGAVARGKNEPQSILSIRIDKAVTPDGNEMRLLAIIFAIASPTN